MENQGKQKKAPGKYAQFVASEYNSWGRSKYENNGKFKAFLSDPDLKKKWIQVRDGKPEPVPEPKGAGVRRSKKGQVKGAGIIGNAFKKAF